MCYDIQVHLKRQIRMATRKGVALDEINRLISEYNDHFAMTDYHTFTGM
jgi:DNA-binding transcriptional MerR regulator